MIILLFGWKKLPDMARSLGRSAKILKAETKGMRSEDEQAAQAPAQQPVQQLPPAQPQVAQPPVAQPVVAQPPVAQPVVAQPVAQPPVAQPVQQPQVAPPIEQGPQNIQNRQSTN
ncbi:twin-arginine translocase TatA/TatE family subunit [Saccharothrix sp. BKS2]|uniref:twin-arginine translocase TatA/TatE family subunit n=1 Tax=Saccharothrix sp. BKS2 TaxID=3064400 RepID=UPI0039E9EB12